VVVGSREREWGKKIERREEEEWRRKGAALYKR
jgi:hypothetical protein